MKLTQQVNSKVSYILLAIVGALMLTMVVWYVFVGGPAEQQSDSSPEGQQQAAGQDTLGAPVRGSMPDATAVEQKLSEEQVSPDQQDASSETPGADAPSAQDVGKNASLDTAESSEIAALETLDNAAQQVADADVAEAEGALADQEVSAMEQRAEAAAAVKQGADAAAVAEKGSVEQAAEEAAQAIEADSPRESAQEDSGGQAAESEISEQTRRSEEKASLQKNKLTAINVVPTQYGVVIRMQTSVPVEKTRWDRIRSPNRVYIDMFGSFRSGVSDKDIPDNPYLKKLRIGLHKDRIRVVADLAAESLPKKVNVHKGSDRVVVLEMSDFR